jgi:riboflavin kinase/FMN adenylyltransferase
MEEDMQYIRNTIEFEIEESTVITLGKFDGLHKGHQLLTNRILEIGKSGLKTVVFTFNIPPNNLLKGKEQQVLLTNDEKYQMLDKMRVDYLIECPFLPEVVQMEPEVFIRDILIGKLHVKHIVVGKDFRFGYQRKGDYRLLQKLSEVYNYVVEVLEKEQIDGRDISSTYIKEEILKGNMEQAAQMLGYPYSVSGEIIHGKELGRTIGIPTINIQLDALKLAPPNGVYVSKTEVDGALYSGITNIGYNPTVSTKAKKVIETHLFECNQDLYGKYVKVELFKYRRPEMKFDSLEELTEAMREDISFGKEYFHE